MMGKQKRHRRGRQKGNGSAGGRARKGRRLREFGDIQLSFGRFAGRPLREIPRSYLDWVVSAVRTPRADKLIVKEYLRLSPPE